MWVLRCTHGIGKQLSLTFDNKNLSRNSFITFEYHHANVAMGKTELFVSDLKITRSAEDIHNLKF